MTRKVTEENRRRLAEWEAECQISTNMKQVLDEAHAAMSANVLTPALLTLRYCDKMLVGLQALTIVELRRIADSLEQNQKGDTHE